MAVMNITPDSFSDGGKKPGPPDGWSDNDKPHGGTPEVHDDLQEAPADDASDPTPKDGTAPTN